MAHYAKLGINSKVIGVHVVDDKDCLNADGIEEFRVEEIGVDRYARLTVQPGIWCGFQGLHTPKSLLLNIANIPHDPNEVEHLALTDINYVWS